LAARVGELEAGRPVVTVCRSGHRARTAAQLLTETGWSPETMAGGTSGWANAGLPMSTPNGDPGRVA